MIKRKINLLFILCFLGLACKDDDVTSRDYPRLKTLPVSNITSDGATFTAEVPFKGDNKILSHGFVWSTIEDPTLENSEKVAINGDINSSSFSLEISSGLISEETYFVKAFLITETFTVYGKSVGFVSLGSKAPSINDIKPIRISYGDTVNIIGSNFSTVNDKNDVSMGGKISKVVFSSDSLIKAIIPDDIESTKFNVVVSILGNTVVSEDTLQFQVPKINSLSSTGLLYGDTLEINGNHFGYENAFNKVRLNDTIIEPITSNRKKITVKIPVTEPDIEISITNTVGQTSNTKLASILNPILTRITPEEAFYENEIELIGKNYGYIEEIVEVYFNDQKATIKEFSNKSISTSLPTGVNNPIDTKIIVNGIEASNSSLYYLGPEITSISPNSGTWGDEITIIGNNYPDNPKDIIVEIGSYEAEVINSSLQEVTIKVPTKLIEETNDVRLTVNDVETVQENSFNLNVPKITNLSSMTGTWNDEVTISTNGYLLMPFSENAVTIDGIDCAIIDGSENFVTVSIPEDLDRQTSSFKLQVYDYSTYSSNFSLSSPIINSTSIKEVTFGDEVTINGKNFHPDNNVISLNNTQLSIISQSPTEIKFNIPEDYYTDKTSLDLEIDANSIKASANSLLTLKTPEFNNISPTYLTDLDTEIIIQGNNFSPSTSNNAINFNGSNLTITSASPTELKGTLNASHVEVEFLTEYVEGAVSLSSGGINATSIFNFDLDYKTAWTVSSEIDGVFMEKGFQIDNEVYVLGDNNLYKYDISNDTWVYLTEFPGQIAYDRIAFTSGGKGYIGLGAIGGTNREGFNQMWEYDPSSNSWTELNNAPVYGTETFYFLEENKVIIGGGYPNSDPKYSVYPFFDVSEKLFEYNPSNDTWSEIGSLPLNNPEIFFTSFAEDETGRNFLITNVDGLLEIYEYIFVTNSWTQLYSNPHFVMSGGNALNNKLYFNARYNALQFYSFDLSSLIVEEIDMPDLRTSQSYRTKFNYNGDLYLGYFEKFLIYNTNFTP